MVQAMMAVGILLPCLQDCKKLVREKLLVENTRGDKKMSYSQVNSLFNAEKDDKITKMTNRTSDVVVVVAAAV
jgi:hypothetical protein